MTAAQVKDLRGLTSRAQRHAQGRFLAEGDHLTAEAMGEGLVQAILLMEGREERFGEYLHQETDVPVYLLPKRSFEQISDTKTPQGIAAVCRLPLHAHAHELGHRIVALNGLQDPGNVGTIIRSIDAAGFTGLLIDAECADPFSPKALRASMGSALRVPVCAVHGLKDSLQGLSGYDIIAGALDGEPFFRRSRTAQKVCLLIGNEGAGLSQELMEMATLRLKLPMNGRAESLNAAVAATVMMYDYVRVWEEMV